MEEKRFSRFKRFVFSRGFILTARTIIALIFIYSGSIKILDLHSFGEAINNYHILPQFLAVPFASLISASDVVLGLLFLLGIFELETGVLLIFLNIVFIMAMSSALFRGIDISCGCFSSEGEALGLKDIFRDFIFILLILWVIVGRKYGKDNI